ncbi:MAG: zinc-dependent peptidase [Pseudohongiellaceae bacterium]
MDTVSIITLIALGLIVLAVCWYVLLWPGQRRRRLLAQPFPAPWIQLLSERLAFYPELTDTQRKNLTNHIKLFLADKHFEGCAGQKINDEIRLVIAAQACLLVLNEKGIPYPELRSVLVYPATFITAHDQRDEFGLVSQHHTVLAGESWSNGRVVLAWDQVAQGVANLHDGYNVVFHEFAHQLDSESGSTNGAPLLGKRGDYSSWAETFSREYQALERQAMHREPSLMDIYGATNPAEFFAVATETFLERPREMASEHPELYQQLARFYGLEPHLWY